MKTNKRIWAQKNLIGGERLQRGLNMLKLQIILLFSSNITVSDYGKSPACVFGRT